MVSSMATAVSWLCLEQPLIPASPSRRRPSKSQTWSMRLMRSLAASPSAVNTAKADGRSRHSIRKMPTRQGLLVGRQNLTWFYATLMVK